MIPLLSFTAFFALTLFSQTNPPPPPVTRVHGAGPEKRAEDTPNPWFWLKAYEGTMTRLEWEDRLHKVYDPFGGLPPFLEITDTEVRIYPSPTERRIPQFILAFAPAPALVKPIPVTYRTPEQFRAMPKPAERPLAGLRLAIDPGHIGGKWAQIEDRSTPYRGLGRIQEGDMNLITAQILERRLTALGAEVILSRHETEPVTTVRPEDLPDEARESYQVQRPELALLPVPEQIRAIGPGHLLEKEKFLFYRKYEFLARAAKFRAFRPDVTIVLYINATPSSAFSRLIQADQNIFFVHGCYTKLEAQDPVQQPRLFYKILDRTLPVEYGVATNIATAFAQTTGLKPVPYQDSSTTRLIDSSNHSVVARNLAANRYYDGPVVTTEPYFMNNRIVAQRLLAGDFEGTRVIEGQPRRSIFQEYAECVIAGLLASYGPILSVPAP